MDSCWHSLGLAVLLHLVGDHSLGPLEQRIALNWNEDKEITYHIADL